ncbi:hypothetical protein OH492_15150 [Vibrio chagasii]|nr:hypothetical protein [Vibrio chagasii]
MIKSVAEQTKSYQVLNAANWKRQERVSKVKVCGRIERSSYTGAAHPAITEAEIEGLSARYSLMCADGVQCY